MIAVQVAGVSKDFPIGDETVRVLHGIDIQIRMGELTMLVGPSGCGKTTLISIMSGILSASEGEVTLLSQPLAALRGAQKVEFRRKYIGFIFQQYNLLPSLTAAENAAMPLLAACIPHAQAVERARAVLARIGMEDQVDKLPRQLSGGQQQRVAIARALVHDPKLIVCDEPTAALDAKAGQAVMQILRDIANEPQRAVLIVTHDNRIYHYADRILEMSDGRIIGDTTPEHFMHKE